MSGDEQQLVAEARRPDGGSAARLRLSLRFELLRTPSFIAAVCGSRVHANVRLSERDGATTMKIIHILYTCAGRADDAVQRQIETLVAEVAQPAV